MLFSKSFGYAIRGVLYIAMMSDEKKRIQIDEIAERLDVPKHFLGKVLNKLVKQGILSSTKGPYGGFSINQNTLSTSLNNILAITDGKEQFSACSLGVKDCTKEKLCVIDSRIQPIRNGLEKVFSETTINTLLTHGKIGIVQDFTV